MFHLRDDLKRSRHFQFNIPSLSFVFLSSSLIWLASNTPFGKCLVKSHSLTHNMPFWHRLYVYLRVNEWFWGKKKEVVWAFTVQPKYVSKYWHPTCPTSKSWSNRCTMILILTRRLSQVFKLNTRCGKRFRSSNKCCVGLFEFQMLHSFSNILSAVCSECVVTQHSTLSRSSRFWIQQPF